MVVVGLKKITDDLLIPVNVITIDRMFKSCTNLISNNMRFIVNDNITSAIETFSNCISLSEFPQYFTISRNIINFSAFCFNCKQLTYLPESFWPKLYFSADTIYLENAFNTNSILHAKLPNKILWDDKRILWYAENAFYNDPANNFGINNITTDDGSTVPANWLRQ